ncbi:hypothetical protein QVD17_27101 [Tagetes erecta]|uniref:Ubiquitin-like protease family profile domain-containing protein n=1 Tax=Tagetes erecta TaxID=13708 RepID=A0AAD8K7T4_TARER|nr:hypothetical protein QVD17_27101 [Tagetes erecta]
MSKKRKRGPASCEQTSDASDFTIEFNENMEGKGPNAAKFSSWIGVKLRTEFSYLIDTKCFRKEKWDVFWLELKNQWHIPNDAPKSLVIKRSKRTFTNWQSVLTRFAKAGSTKVHGGLFSSGRIQNENDVSFTQGRNDAGLLPSPGVHGSSCASDGHYIDYLPIEMDASDEDEQHQSQHLMDNEFMDNILLENFNVFDNVPKSPVPQAPVSQALVPQALVTDLQPIAKAKAKTKANAKTKAKEKSKQEVATDLALEKIAKERPLCMQILAAKLRSIYGDEITMQVNSPPGMYPSIVTEYLEFEGVIQCLSNGMLDCGFIHWFEMYLYELSSNRSSSKCAFLNPMLIRDYDCINFPKNVQKHLLYVSRLHNAKSYILAPFLVGPHYVLVIISPKQKRGYILDSLKGTKNEKSYPFSKVVEDSFEGNFTWAMVNCKQQLGSWECGFMILKYMFEFILHEDDSPTNIWNDTSLVTQPEIDSLIENIMKEFLKVLDEASNVGEV